MEPTEHNRRAWDELQRRRSTERSDRLRLTDRLRAYLPEIAGRHVLHLACETGEATAGLAELGALVTGVDDSPDDLEAARANAPTAVFLVGDVQVLPAEVRRGRFELVLATRSLDRVSDLDAWAAGAVAALRPAGTFVIHDVHPVARCVDATLRWRGSYFDEPGQVSSVVNALARAGLRLERLDELPADGPPRRHVEPVPAELVIVARKPPATSAP
jgi:SAM-dependent methyltransferase